MNMNIYWDFQICISSPWKVLNRYFISLTLNFNMANLIKIWMICLKYLTANFYEHSVCCLFFLLVCLLHFLSLFVCLFYFFFLYRTIFAIIVLTDIFTLITYVYYYYKHRCVVSLLTLWLQLILLRLCID